MRGARSFDHLLCAPRPSRIAGNLIGEAGCIALSSSLVHLLHIQELHLDSEFVAWSGAFVVILLFGADFVLLLVLGCGYEGGGFFLFILIFF